MTLIRCVLMLTTQMLDAMVKAASVKQSIKQSTKSIIARESTISTDTVAPRISIIADKTAELVEFYAPELVGDVDDEDHKELSGWPLQKRIFQANRPEWKFVGLGMVFAAAAGCVFPVQSLVLTNLINALGSLAYDPEQVCRAARTGCSLATCCSSCFLVGPCFGVDRLGYIIITSPAAQLYKKVCEFSLIYVAIAVVSGLCMTGMVACYRTVGEKLTTRLREKTFAYVVHRAQSTYQGQCPRM
jgi:hypothetical protein